MKPASRVPLGEVCTLNPRLTKHERPAPDLPISFVPMAAVDEVDGIIERSEQRSYSQVAKGYTSFRERDVLFAKITPCMENGKAALALGLTNGLGFGSTEFHVLRCSEHIMPEYLFFYVRRPEFRRLAKANFTGTAGQQRVPSDFLANVVVPLPPLTEQRRIVDILSRADGIRRLRRRALGTVRGLVPALFHAMFGNGSGNDYETRPLKAVAEIVSGVTKGRKLRDGDTVEVPYLRVANVQAGRLNLSEIKMIPATMTEIDRLRLKRGDVLLTEGGDFDKLGRGAVWNDELPEAIHQNHVFRVRPDRQALHERYLAAFLQTDDAKRYFLRCAKRTTNLASINKTQLGDLPVPCPPVSEQTAFVEKATMAEDVIASCARMEEAADRLFASLMARVFDKPALRAA